jgi:hypothetical protein
MDLTEQILYMSYEQRVISHRKKKFNQRSIYIHANNGGAVWVNRDVHARCENYYHVSAFIDTLQYRAVINPKALNEPASSSENGCGKPP